MNITLSPKQYAIFEEYKKGTPLIEIFQDRASGGSTVIETIAHHFLQTTTGTVHYAGPYGRILLAELEHQYGRGRVRKIQTHKSSPPVNADDIILMDIHLPHNGEELNAAMRLLAMNCAIQVVANYIKHWHPDRPRAVFNLSQEDVTWN